MLPDGVGLIAAEHSGPWRAVGGDCDGRGQGATKPGGAATENPLHFPARHCSAMVHAAIHDALNAIDPRYERGTMVPPATPEASPDAAIASAARDVVVNRLGARRMR